MKGEWALWNYFDVWGNEEDGWDVNDLCKEREGLEIPERDDEIIDFLINDVGFIRPQFREIIRLDWMDFGWCKIVCDVDERPLGRLVKEV